MLLSDIVSEVKRKTRRSGTAIENTIGACFNNVTEFITSNIALDCMKHEEAFTINSGDYYKDLPADFAFPNGDPVLKYDTVNGFPLDKKDRAWFDLNFPQLANSGVGKPYAYMFDKKRLVFAYPSDDTYTLMLPYHLVHPKVSTDGDTIYFPDSNKRLLIVGTLAELFDDLGQDDKQAKYQAEYSAMLTVMGIYDARKVKAPTQTVYRDI